MRPDVSASVLKFVLLASLVLFSAMEAAAQTRTKSATPSDASLAPVRAKIAQKCMYEPSRYFGVGTQNVTGRCECYAAGVSKLLSSEEIGYLNRYDKIPNISKDQFAKIQKACAEGGAPQPGAKPGPKKKA
jgi:hypothetical protein